MDLCKNICFCFILIFLFAIFFLDAKDHRGGKLRNVHQGTTTKTGAQKAAEMCDKYTRQACGAPPPANSGARIAGGIKVFDHRFPHMAAIGAGNVSDINDHWCGASLISESYLLTAAHCVVDANTTLYTFDYSVRMGDLNLKNHTDDQHFIVARVREVIVYPWYINGWSCFGDLALIRIDPITFTEWVRPICLNTNSFVPNVSLTVTGWGQKIEKGKGSPRLRYTEIYQLNYFGCVNDVYNNYDDTAMMCVGYLMGGKDACFGDSGGPLQMPIKDSPYACNVPIWSQVGIVSCGAEGCGRPFKPSTYTRVSYFIDWIANIVWKNM